MKQFIKKILVFVAPIIILPFPLDFIVSNTLKDKGLYAGEYEVWNDILESRIDAEIAIYGSSRAWVHFNPVLFEKELQKKTYNFGIDGHNFWLQYLRHKEYFKYNKHPKLIIYSVDIFTLAKRKDLYNRNQFLPYMLWNKDFYKWTNPYNGFDKFDYIIPIKRYISNISLSVLFSHTPTLRYKGYKGMEREWYINLKKIRKEKPNYRIKLDTNSINLFKQFINEMKKEGVKIIFVYSPEYIKGQTFVKNRQEIISILKKIANNNNIPFFDYSNSEISNNKSLFYNTLHLNEQGANIFTESFIQDLKKYERTTKNIVHTAGSCKHER